MQDHRMAGDIVEYCRINPNDFISFLYQESPRQSDPSPTYLIYMIR